MSDTRLIEVAFPLKQTSLDSVHEKNVRHGHISTLHIWPARRPLAASRAALIATLLPDPGDPEERRKILERLAGKVVQKTKKQKGANGKVEERTVEETVGGILHWGRESGPDLDWFREQIRAAYGGRAPRVLDPFAGGGAIPLEAMRLGCEVTAGDINPVAWFILKCTLEYPQKLAGQKMPLPAFALEDEEFMEQFRKAHGLTTKAPKPRGKKQTKEQPATYAVADQHEMFETPASYSVDIPEADLAWHVRAWGRWVFHRARADLERFYPTIDDKPTVAYLWARTVRCKNCRATIPLLKTRWLCKKDNKRVVLTMKPNADRTGVIFGIQNEVPKVGVNATQRRQYDMKVGQGTMSRSGVWCPCCGKPGTVAMTSDDLRNEAREKRMFAQLTAVVVDGSHGKEYRNPTTNEIQLPYEAEPELEQVFTHIPFGLPEDPVPQGGSRTGGGSPFTVHMYGLTRWRDLFSPRQLLALGTFVRYTRDARHVMSNESYSAEWIEAVCFFLSTAIDRMVDFNSQQSTWILSVEAIRNAIVRYALPISWDYGEAAPINDVRGGYLMCVDKVGNSMETIFRATSRDNLVPKISKSSAIQNLQDTTVDLICTDPPYYDAIPYSDLMDFFYIWLRRTLYGLSDEVDAAFDKPLAPKWDHIRSDGELIDDASRFDGDKVKSKAIYEDGMFRAFQACYSALASQGRLVIVFAHKHPDAWETLVSATIRAGFVVDGSWPIQTSRQLE